MHNLISTTVRGSLALLLAAGGAALSAQGKASEQRFGVNLTLSVTIDTPGDTPDMLGVGFGAFWEMPFFSTANLTGRASLNYVTSGATEGVHGGYYQSVDYGMNQLGLAYDALWLSGEQFYVLGGLGYYSSKASKTVNDGKPQETEYSGIGFNLGGGYRLGKHFAIEYKYVLTSEYPRQQVSWMWRF